jgi:hypothetical protein
MKFTTYRQQSPHVHASTALIVVVVLALLFWYLDGRRADHGPAGWADVGIVIALLAAVVIFGAPNRIAAIADVIRAWKGTKGG